MAWQDNLFNNLIVVAVLFTLFVIVYCKIKKKTVGDLIKELREAIKGNE